MSKTLSLRALDLPAIHKFGIGFDSLFDELLRTTSQQVSSNYPPHNVIRTGENTLTIEVAVAGFKQGEVDVTVENHVLTITGHKERIEEVGREFLHRGISSRDFKQSFTLSEWVEVISATVADGILTIDLERIVPEEKKPKNININYVK